MESGIQKEKEQNKNQFQSGKTITMEADERLKKIRGDINKGNFKKKISEREIISRAILCLGNDEIEKLKAERASGEEVMLSGLKDLFNASQSEGQEMCWDEFLKETVSPMLNSHLKSKIKNQKKVSSKKGVNDVKATS